MLRIRIGRLLLGWAMVGGSLLHAQVASFEKLSDAPGGLPFALDDQDRFGWSIAPLGDLDDDGVGDVIVGAIFDDDGGSSQADEPGAVYILFLNADSSVKAFAKISETSGGWAGGIETKDDFGFSVAGLGDLDGDGVEDAAVGARRDDDGGLDHGAVYIFFLRTDGSVKAHQKISSTQGNFQGTLQVLDDFGLGLDAIGDLDGDGTMDLAVGANDGGNVSGAVWILFLNPDGTVRAHQKINESEGNFHGTLADADNFGVGLARLGDVDGDGTFDLAVGASGDSGGGFLRGAVWILFLHADGTVKGHQKLATGLGGFTGNLRNFDLFGTAVDSAGDLDRDGVPDLLVSSLQNGGKVWLVFLNRDGSVREHQLIAAGQGGFGGAPASDSLFGQSLGHLADLDGDRRPELLVGAPLDSDGGTQRGAFWILHLGTQPRLDIAPDPATAGEAVEFQSSHGVAGQPAVLLLLAVDGLPTQALVAAAGLSAQGDWSHFETVPADPALVGANFGLRTFTLDAFGGLVASAEATLGIR